MSIRSHSPSFNEQRSKIECQSPIQPVVSVTQIVHLVDEVKDYLVILSESDKDVKDVAKL